MNEPEFSGCVISTDHDTDMPYILTAAPAREENEISFAERFTINFHAFRILSAGARAE